MVILKVLLNLKFKKDIKKNGVIKILMNFEIYIYILF